MASDLLFVVAEFHRVQVIKAINIIWGNCDFIVSLVTARAARYTDHYQSIAELQMKTHFSAVLFQFKSLVVIQSYAGRAPYP